MALHCLGLDPLYVSRILRDVGGVGGVLLGLEEDLVVHYTPQFALLLSVRYRSTTEASQWHRSKLEVL